MGIFGSAQREPLGLSGFGPMQTATPNIPSAPQIKEGFFSAENIAKILGTLGDTLQNVGGGQGSFLPQLLRQRQQEQERQRGLQDYQRQRQDHTADWQAQQQWKIDHPEQPEIVQRLAAAGIDPASEQGKEAILRSVPNFQFTQPVMDARQQMQQDLIDRRGQVQSGLIGQRTQASASLKGMPTYSALHPSGGGRGITPTARAKYISDAQAAISRGADPSKVHARLKQMGVE